MKITSIITTILGIVLGIGVGPSDPLEFAELSFQKYAVSELRQAF